MLQSGPSVGFCVPVRQFRIVKRAAWGYTGGMDEEPQDFNAFNHWDSAGAVLLLAIAAAALNYTFNDKNITWSAIIVIVGVAAAVVVFFLQFITKSKHVGSIVCYVGGILTLLYLLLAILGWRGVLNEPDPVSPPQEEAPQQEAR